MKILGVIPARFGSTRFPGKPLVDLLGKPLIQWVIDSAKKSRSLSKIIVATDHEEIRKISEASGVEAVMTDSELPSGTDRVFAASQTYDSDIVINIQGDEPLINPKHIDLLAAAFNDKDSTEMATLAHPISEEDLKSPHAVKVIVDQNSYGIYFSRFAIPFSRMSMADSDNKNLALKHIGMYAYTSKFLKEFCQAPPVALEKAEALEQLRALYLGKKIKVIEVNQAFPGVDTPEDLKKIKWILENRRPR